MKLYPTPGIHKPLFSMRPTAKIEIVIFNIEESVESLEESVT